MTWVLILTQRSSEQAQNEKKNISMNRSIARYPSLCKDKLPTSDSKGILLVFENKKTTHTIRNHDLQNSHSSDPNPISFPFPNHPSPYSILAAITKLLHSFNIPIYLEKNEHLKLYRHNHDFLELLCFTLRQIDRPTHRQSDTQTVRYTDSQTARQTNYRT